LGSVRFFNIYGIFIFIFYFLEIIVLMLKKHIIINVEISCATL